MRLRLPPVLYPQMIRVTMKRDLAEIEKRYLSARGLKLGNTGKLIHSNRHTEMSLSGDDWRE